MIRLRYLSDPIIARKVSTSDFLHSLDPFRKSRLHPDKTFIGRSEKGFDFLGYHFSRDGLRVAMVPDAPPVPYLPDLVSQRAIPP